VEPVDGVAVADVHDVALEGSFGEVSGVLITGCFAVAAFMKVGGGGTSPKQQV